MKAKATLDTAFKVPGASMVFPPNSAKGAKDANTAPGTALVEKDNGTAWW
jgi:hypothetical protein